MGLSDSVLITKLKQHCAEELGMYRKKFQIIGTVKACYWKVQCVHRFGLNTLPQSTPCHIPEDCYLGSVKICEEFGCYFLKLFILTAELHSEFTGHLPTTEKV